MGGKDPKLDPGSTIIIEFANGVRALANIAKGTPQIFEFDLQGPNGRLWVEDSRGRTWKTDKPEGQLSEVPATWATDYHEALGGYLISAVQELAQMIWHDIPSSSPPERAVQTLEIMCGALISQVQGNVKVHLPLSRS